MGPNILKQLKEEFRMHQSTYGHAMSYKKFRREDIEMCATYVEDAFMLEITNNKIFVRNWRPCFCVLKEHELNLLELEFNQKITCLHFTKMIHL